MKLVVLILTIGLCYINSMEAQQPTNKKITPETRAKVQTVRMERDLDLSVQQKDKILQINIETEIALQDCLTIEDPVVRKNKIAETNTKRGNAFKLILNEQQYSLYLQKP